MRSVGFNVRAGASSWGMDLHWLVRASCNCFPFLNRLFAGCLQRYATRAVAGHLHPTCHSPKIRIRHGLSALTLLLSRLDSPHTRSNRSSFLFPHKPYAPRIPRPAGGGSDQRSGNASEDTQTFMCNDPPWRRLGALWEQEPIDDGARATIPFERGEPTTYGWIEPNGRVDQLQGGCLQVVDVC